MPCSYVSALPGPKPSVTESGSFLPAEKSEFPMRKAGGRCEVGPQEPAGRGRELCPGAPVAPGPGGCRPGPGRVQCRHQGPVLVLGGRVAGSTVCAFAAAIVWHTHRTMAETSTGPDQGCSVITGHTDRLESQPLHLSGGGGPGGAGAGPGTQGWHATCSASHCPFCHTRQKLVLQVMRLPGRAGRESLRASPAPSAR